MCDFLVGANKARAAREDNPQRCLTDAPLTYYVSSLLRMSLVQGKSPASELRSPILDLLPLAVNANCHLILRGFAVAFSGDYGRNRIRRHDGQTSKPYPEFFLLELDRLAGLVHLRSQHLLLQSADRKHFSRPKIRMNVQRVSLAR